MMSRRAEWKRVLDAEVARWSEMPCEQLIKELHEVHEERVYLVEAGAKQFQVEVELVENTSEYLHVVLSVDDGSLPESIFPVTSGFIRKKGETA
jgi:hypothetical protein